MINKIKITLIVSTIVLLSSNVNSAQKDCSVFKHKFDRNICEAQNRENLNDTTSSSASSSASSSVSNAGEKASGFFKKIGSKLKLKKHKKFREQGDQ